MTTMEIDMENNNEENINPYYGEMETRYGALKVPEINDNTETENKNEKRLIPILKFDDWGNEIGKV